MSENSRVTRPFQTCHKNDDFFTWNPEFAAPLSITAKQNQKMTKLRLHPENERPIRAKAGPKWPIVLKLLRMTSDLTSLDRRREATRPQKMENVHMRK